MKKTEQQQINDKIGECFEDLSESMEMFAKNRDLMMRLVEFGDTRIDSLENKIDILMTERAEREEFELAKKELGYESFKSKNELLKILGVNSFLNFFLANIFAFFYDFKYSSSLRKGNKLADKNLKKYISVARNNNSL